MAMRTYRFVVEATATGYSAYEEAEPVFTTGRTLEELRENAREALELYLEDDADQVPGRCAIEFANIPDPAPNVA